MKKLLKLLKFLLILQEVSNKNRSPKLGLGYSTAIRVNPYNPLSYIALIPIVVVGVLMYGIIGIFGKREFVNPFKWK